MAQKGAHLTTNISTKPSLFEIIAQDSLDSTLEPALRRIIQVLSLKNPERYSRLELYFDEIFVGFNLLLQGYNLRYNKASYSEKFYGLERFNIKGTSPNDELTKKQFFISIFTLVIFPYIKSKLYKKINQMKIDEMDRRSTNSINDSTRRKLILSHQMIHFLMESSVLVQYFRYMSGRSIYAKPSLWLANICLVYKESSNVQNRALHLIKTFSLGKLLSLALSQSMDIAAFLLHFLHWWNQAPSQPNLTALPIPEPPQTHTIDQRFKDICPICLQKRQIDTCLRVSGYIFCFGCITDYVKKHNHCPVSKYPAALEDLIRIYYND